MNSFYNQAIPPPPPPGAPVPPQYSTYPQPTITSQWHNKTPQTDPSGPPQPSYYPPNPSYPTGPWPSNPVHGLNHNNQQRWTIVSPQTEQATPEVIAVLNHIFDTLDQRFEPFHSGLCEAPKIIDFFRLQNPNNTFEVFTANNYHATGLWWSFSGVEHIMVPCKASLRPLQSSFSSTNTAVYPNTQIALCAPVEPICAPSYIPALTRRGFLQLYFQDLCHDPEALPKYMRLLHPNGIPSFPSLPDITHFDPTVPQDLARRAKLSDEGAATRAIAESTAAMQRAGSANNISEWELLVKQRERLQANTNNISFY